MSVTMDSNAVINGMASVDPAALQSVSAIASAIEAVRIEAHRLGLTTGSSTRKGRHRIDSLSARAGSGLAHEMLLTLTRTEAGRYGLKVTEGRMVIEIRPLLVTNKGTAVQRIIAEAELSGLVFLGDDLTDVDAFRAVSQSRADGKIAGANVAVAAPETHPEVFAAADVVLHGVETGVALLSSLADSFEGTDGAVGVDS